MKFSRETHDGARVGSRARACFGERVPAQLGERRREVGLAHEVVDDARLDQAPRLEHVARLGHRGLGDEGSAVGLERDHAFVRETRQHAPDARAAHAENAREAVLAELRSRRQAMVEDRREDLLVDRFLAQGSAALRLARPSAASAQPYFC